MFSIEKDLPYNHSVCYNRLAPQSKRDVYKRQQLTYTFVLQNFGNTAATAGDNVILTDTFDPALTGLTVTYNGDAWTEGDNYTYDAATGTFATIAGQITVPAATYTQETDGTYTVTPGTTTVTVTGTV